MCTIWSASEQMVYFRDGVYRLHSDEHKLSIVYNDTLKIYDLGIKMECLRAV